LLTTEPGLSAGSALNLLSRYSSYPTRSRPCASKEIKSVTINWLKQQWRNTPSKALSECYFTYYPGAPRGYAGYTDHHAIRCDLNDWLLKETIDNQLWLAGFGAGFVTAAMRYCEEYGRIELMTELRVKTSEKKITESIDWIQRLQLSGVDNADPSTENLLNALNSICISLGSEGPVHRKYWKDDAELQPAPPFDAVYHKEKIDEARQRGLQVRFE
jgi:hypothetical protein